MITTSTPEFKTNQEYAEVQNSMLPEFAEPSVKTIESILNYSRNLEIKKSEYIDCIEVIKS